MVVLDLFSGAGGLSLGFQDAGFCVAAGLDASSLCAETYSANFPAKSLSLDLTGITTTAIQDLVHNRLEVPRVDVVIGGPPCQGFAAVGQAKIRSLVREQGDEYRERLVRRNHLYREFVRFVGALTPLCFVMENVPHLASFEGGAIAADIREDFDRLGYDLGTIDRAGAPILVEAASFGVPQTRRRLFFIGIRRGLMRSPSDPTPTHAWGPVQLRSSGSKPQLQISQPSGVSSENTAHLNSPRTLADAIADLPRMRAPALDHVLPYNPQQRDDLVARGVLRDLSYVNLMRKGCQGGGESVLYDHVVRPVRDDDREAFRYMPEGGVYLDIPEEYRRYRADEDHFPDRYFRLPWGRPSRAITAHIAKDGYWYIHPDADQERTLSVREAARIQSFPDHFRFAGHRTNMFTQIGNAVPPLLANAVALQVRLVLERGSSRGDAPEKIPRGPSTGMDNLFPELSAQ